MTMNYTVNTLISKSSLSAYEGDFVVLVDWLVCPFGSSRISSNSAGDGTMPVPGGQR